MARVTVEDCLEHCKDRFYLVLSAAGRAHRLESGQDEPMVDPNNDKPTVIALREIAQGYDVDQNTVETVAREEEDRLAERFMAIKRGDAIADAMSLMPDENIIPVELPSEAVAELSFSEHLKLATEAIDSLSADTNKTSASDESSEQEADESDKQDSE